MERRHLLTSIASVAAGCTATTGASLLAANRRERATANPGSSLITTGNGNQLFYRDWGTGRPIVFISGWALPSDMWWQQMVPLSEHGARCVAYDRRGHGRSADPGRDYDYDTLADDFAAVLDSLDLRDVTLVAHSMGSGEAVRYLTRHGSKRVARLVLLAPVGMPYLARAPGNPGGTDQAIFEQFRSQVLLQDFPKWLDDNAKPFVVPETSTATIAWLKGLMLQTSMKALLECNRTLTSTDFRAELVRLRTPTLVLQGDRDASGPVEHTGRRVAEIVPGTRLKIYEGAPHGLFLTHAARINQDILDFMA